MRFLAWKLFKSFKTLLVTQHTSIVVNRDKIQTLISFFVFMFYFFNFKVHWVWWWLSNALRVLGQMRVKTKDFFNHFGTYPLTLTILRSHFSNLWCHWYGKVAHWNNAVAFVTGHFWLVTLRLLPIPVNPYCTLGNYHKRWPWLAVANCIFPIPHVIVWWPIYPSPLP